MPASDQSEEYSPEPIRPRPRWREAGLFDKLIPLDGGSIGLRTGKHLQPSPLSAAKGRDLAASKKAAPGKFIQGGAVSFWTPRPL